MGYASRIKKQGIMGYTTGIKWTDDLIAENVLRIANMFEPKRMPSNREIIEIEGNHKLSMAVQKNGGFTYWANKLGLEQKYSETKLGIVGEKCVADELSHRGHFVEMTSTKHPYDILVDGCIKVDVKTSNESYIRGCAVHAYRLAKRQQTCDFYIFYEADTGKIYIVPAHKCHGQVQVEMGNDSKAYKQYLGAFDLINQASEMYQRM